MEIKEFGENGAGYRLRKFIVRFDVIEIFIFIEFEYYFLSSFTNFLHL